jgi:hypothetical protein
MAALTVFTPTAPGTVYTTTAVSASDTIAQAAIGPRGAYLLITNAGGSPDSVVVVDGSLTPAGNASANLTNSVAAGTSEVMFIPSSAVNSATGLITVTHSFITTVTCIVLSLPGF